METRDTNISDEIEMAIYHAEKILDHMTEAMAIIGYLKTRMPK